MKSWEILREAVDRIGAKVIAARLRVSTALVYKWCQPPAGEDGNASGAFNPLDRLQVIFETTRDPRLINWVCRRAGGFFVENPATAPAHPDLHLLDSTQRLVEEFGRLLSAVSRGVANDGEINPDEAKHIRECWESLKGKAEAFVTSCERGDFRDSAR